VPVGYLVSVLIAAGATAVSLWPRPARGARPTPAFVLESVANELPFIIVYWVVADTAIAATQGNLGSPLGWLGLAIAVFALSGQAVVIVRAGEAPAVLDNALEAGLGQTRLARPRRRGVPLGTGRVLVAPLRIPARGVRRERNVPYGPSGRENQLDVYRHRSRPAGCPMLVYFHPGGFIIGGKSREARALFDRLVGAGWVCISANYRLGRAGAFPNNLIDAKRAIAWLRAHASEYGADPRTIIMCGASAGAYLAAMCALTPDNRTFQPGFEQDDTSVSAAVGFYGYYGSPWLSEGDPSDPIAYARTDAPPFFVIHGARDPMVAPGNPRQFVEQLRAVSARPVVYAELPGGQHNFDRFASIRFFAVVDAVEAFATWVRSGSGP
jgi:acetyl esterase/lipase